MDRLGHLIDDHGIHVDSDKMSRIHGWCTPRNKHNMQRFLRLVQYLAHFMPDVSVYTGPLAVIQKNSHPFLWKPMHQVCMDNIKVLACKVPTLRPIDLSRDKPIWFICDASASGIGAIYGQGPDWQSCRPAGFTIPLCMVATVMHHAGLVALPICNLVTCHMGLVANCHTLLR